MPILFNTTMKWKVVLVISRFGKILGLRLVSGMCVGEAKSPSITTKKAAVETINSCTSRPDVCQCLVAQTPVDKMSKNKPSSSMTHVSDETMLSLDGRSGTCVSIHTQETVWQSGLRYCIMPGLLTHIM